LVAGRPLSKVGSVALDRTARNHQRGKTHYLTWRELKRNLLQKKDINHFYEHDLFISTFIAIFSGSILVQESGFWLQNFATQKIALKSTVSSNSFNFSISENALQGTVLTGPALEVRPPCSELEMTILTRDFDFNRNVFPKINFKKFKF
jgi:hypothetical protein